MSVVFTAGVLVAVGLVVAAVPVAVGVVDELAEMPAILSTSALLCFLVPSTAPVTAPTITKRSTTIPRIQRGLRKPLFFSPRGVF